MEFRQQQPRRPTVKPGEFIGLSASKVIGISPDTIIQPKLLCTKYMPIRTWLEVNRDVGEKEVIEFEHHSSSIGTEIEIEYLNGCHLCTLFWAAFDSRFVRGREMEIRMDKLRIGKNAKVVLRKAHDLDTALFEIQLEIGPLGEKLFGNEIEIAASEQHPSSKKRSRHGEPHVRDYSVELSNSSVTVSTSASSVIRLASKWLNNCAETHKRCLSSSNTSLTLPKRLFDGGGIGGALKLRLIPADGGLSGIKYVALSYCWGKTEGLKLAISNMKNLTSGISYEMLPKTIEDAVLVTQKLGYRWLWVDSLCIIQDSPEDSKQETASMVNVYSNCFLCIAVTGAKDSDESLFTQRDPLIYTPCRMNPHACKALYAFPPQPSWENFRSCFEESTLHERGWVTQELILPPKTLSFSSVLFWDCREQCRNEFNMSTATTHGETMKSRFLELVLQRDNKTQPMNADLKVKSWTGGMRF